jgi:hypothetical protein
VEYTFHLEKCERCFRIVSTENQKRGLCEQCIAQLKLSSCAQCGELFAIDQLDDDYECPRFKAVRYRRKAELRNDKTQLDIQTETFFREMTKDPVGISGASTAGVPRTADHAPKRSANPANRHDVVRVLDRLIEWAAHMGGWTAPVWTDIVALRDELSENHHPLILNPFPANDLDTYLEMARWAMREDGDRADLAEHVDYNEEEMERLKKQLIDYLG